MITTCWEVMILCWKWATMFEAMLVCIVSESTRRRFPQATIVDMDHITSHCLTRACDRGGQKKLRDERKKEREADERAPRFDNWLIQESQFKNWLCDIGYCLNVIYVTLLFLNVSIGYDYVYWRSRGWVCQLFRFSFSSVCTYCPSIKCMESVFNKDWYERETI